MQDAPHLDTIDEIMQDSGYDRECECDSCPFVRESIIENAQFAIAELRAGRPAAECRDSRNWYIWYRAHTIVRSCRAPNGVCDGSCNTVVLIAAERVLAEYAVVIRFDAGGAEAAS